MTLECTKTQHFPYKVTLIFGRTNGKNMDGPAPNAGRLDPICQRMSKLFGGCTRYDHFGHWFDGDGVLVKDPGVTLVAYSDLGYIDTANGARELAQMAAEIFGQEAVITSVDPSSMVLSTFEPEVAPVRKDSLLASGAILGHAKRCPCPSCLETKGNKSPVPPIRAHSFAFNPIDCILGRVKVPAHESFDSD